MRNYRFSYCRRVRNTSGALHFKKLAGIKRRVSFHMDARNFVFALLVGIYQPFI
jgi:hypothetical protein